MSDGSDSIFHRPIQRPAAIPETLPPSVQSPREILALCFSTFHNSACPQYTLSPIMSSVSPLEIMPAVAQIEGFIDQREVGHDVPEDGIFQGRPEHPGGVMGMAAVDPIGLIGAHPGEDLTAPALHPTDATGIGCGGIEGCVNSALRQLREDL